MTKAKKQIEEIDNELTMVTVPSGRVMELRPLPEHFYTFYGQLPNHLTAKAMEALKNKGDKNNQQIGLDIIKELTDEQIHKTLIMMREAVKYVCVKPSISLDPQTKDEISPLELTIADFNYLSAWAMQSLGVEAQSAENFRK